MKFGILREGKMPRNKRVPFTPTQCVVLQNEFGIDLVIQPSEWRNYTDDEYRAAGIRIQEDISDCDVLFGIKEVTPSELVAGKKYLFFSHTIREQARDQALMHALIAKKIQMIDYECLTDAHYNRIIGFGYYAGIVGVYHAIYAYGKRSNLFNLKPAYECHNLVELRDELQKIHLTNIKIIVTGNGRVASGALEMMKLLHIRRVTPHEFTHDSFHETVYTQLHSHDYNEPKDGGQWDRGEFYSHPEKFRGTFAKFTPHCDMLIHCSFWNPHAPKLFEKQDMKNSDFRIKVIADVTCDMNGSIPSTTEPSSINEPFYGYDPINENVTAHAFDKDVITVMAVDNLPCTLPRDASESFGKQLIEKVIPAILGNDPDGLIERASICKNGKLTERFQYMSDFAY